MSIRENIAKCITAAKGNPEEAAKLVIGHLYSIDLLEPGNGWLDDDETMQASLDDYYTKSNAVLGKKF